MALKQEHRMLAMDTALGPNVLGVRTISVQEHLGRLFQIEAELSSEDGEIDFNQVVGHNATIRLELGPKGQTRYFNGYVSRLVQEPNRGGYAHYRATLVPWLWFLTRTSDCRIFQQKTVPEIIKQVLSDHGYSDFKDKLTVTYPQWEYCVQYRETDFNFISRLMEQEGIYYFFEHENGKHTLVLADSASAHKPFTGYEEIDFHVLEKGGPGQEIIHEWVVEKEVQPGAYSLNDFDFENPKASLLSNSTVTRQHGAAAFAHYDYPGEYVKAAEGDRLAQVRLDELQAQHEILRGQASARGLVPGCTFTLKKHPRADQEREYLVTSVSLQADAGEFASTPGTAGGGEFFTCSFTALDSQQAFRSPRLTPRPVIQGPQTALVVGPSGEEIHTDKYGRVKVMFHWDRYAKADENSSCWIRVAQEWAGKKWGAVYTPRIGQEVVVEFLEGDPDRPIITGRVYNAGAMPPYALPDHKTISTLKSSSSKGSGGFNEIRFEDQKGEEQVFIQAEKNADIRVKHDVFEWVGNNRHLIAKKDQLEQVGGNRNEIVEGEHLEKIGKDYHLKIVGQAAMEIGGSRSLAVKGDVVEDFKANHSSQVAQNLYLKATGVVIEAQSGITLKVGGNSVVVDQSGVTVKGIAVTLDGATTKINSGPGSPPTAGTAGQLAAPKDPAKPDEADQADPGEMEAMKRQQRQTKAGKYGSVKVADYQPPGSGAGEESSEKVWLEFQLLDAAEKPVASEPYQLKYSSGKEESGRLDGQGLVRKEVDAGETVRIHFPKRGNEEWEMHRVEDA